MRRLVNHTNLHSLKEGPLWGWPQRLSAFVGIIMLHFASLVSIRDATIDLVLFFLRLAAVTYPWHLSAGRAGVARLPTSVTESDRGDKMAWRGGGKL